MQELQLQQASYHMATRALANLSHEGIKLAKCPRDHVISSTIVVLNISF